MKKTTSLTLIRATEADFERMADFYRYVIDNTDNMMLYCRWVYGQHPSDEMLHRYIGEGAMYYAEREGKLLSVMAALPYQEENYHETQWGAELADDEVAALHIFCVDPKYAGQGCGRAMMHAIAELMAASGKKAIRLDTLESNLASQSLYESLGYIRRDMKCWQAQNTGWTNFILYEKLL